MSAERPSLGTERAFTKALFLICALASGAFSAPVLASGGAGAEREGFFDRIVGGGAARWTAADDGEGAIEETCRNLIPYYGCTIDTIIVRDNEHTKPVSILREMATKQGSCLNEKLVRRDAAYLRGLGYFAEVALRAERTGPGSCRLIVSVTDRPGLFMRYPYPVVNYDFEKGLSYGFTWKLKNFRGNAEDLAVSAIRRQEKEQGAGFSWSNPWFSGRRIRFRADAAAYRRLEEPEDEDEEYIREIVSTGVGVGIPLSRSLVRQLWVKPSLTFESRISRRMLPDDGGTVTPAYYRQNFVAAGGELEYDSRSDRISPFDGMVARFRVRRFSSVHGLDENYIMYGTANYFYLPTGEERSFVIALRSDIREGSLPSFFDMRLGGVRDVRGYANQSERGQVKFVGTLQYRSRFIGPSVLRIPKIGRFDIAFNWTAFFDTGTLTSSVLDLDRSVFHSTMGFGIEMISPLRDNMRFEVASDGTGKPAFYITSGTDF